MPAPQNTAHTHGRPIPTRSITPPPITTTTPGATRPVSPQAPGNPVPPARPTGAVPRPAPGVVR